MRKVLRHLPSASVDILPAMFALTFVLSPLASCNASGAIPYPRGLVRSSAGFLSPPERQPASPKGQKQTVMIGKRTGALFIYLFVVWACTHWCICMCVVVYMHMCTHVCVYFLNYSSSHILSARWLVRLRDSSIFTPWVLGLQVYVTTSGFLHGCRGSSLSSWGKQWLNQLCSCSRPVL